MAPASINAARKGLGSRHHHVEAMMNTDVDNDRDDQRTAPEPTADQVAEGLLRDDAFYNWLLKRGFDPDTLSSRATLWLAQHHERETIARERDHERERERQQTETQARTREQQARHALATVL